jgi:hypothetical protein
VIGWSIWLTVLVMGELGRTLMLLGVALLVVGAILSLGWRLPWLGRLPGDIAIERENFRFYFPLATSIVISIVLSLIAMLFRR